MARTAHHIREHRPHRRVAASGVQGGCTAPGGRGRPGTDRTRLRGGLAVGVVERGERLLPTPALGVAPGRGGHRAPPRAARGQIDDRLGQVAGIAAARHPAGHPGLHVLPRSPLVRHDDRQAARLGFQHHVAGGVGAARKHEDVRRRHRPRHVPAIQRPRKDRPRQPPLQLGAIGAVADDDPTVRDTRSPEPRRHVGQQIQLFLLRDPSGIQEHHRSARSVGADPPGLPQGGRPAARRERLGVHPPHPQADARRLDPVLDEHRPGCRPRHEDPLAAAVQPAHVEPEPALDPPEPLSIPT